MKIQAKSTPIATDDSPGISQDLGPGSPTSPGGPKAPHSDAMRQHSASLAPMVIPRMDTERSMKRLKANGFNVPQIELRIRAPWEWGAIRAVSAQLTTPLGSDTYALRWIRAFRAREIGTGGVAAIKSRVRLDATTIWRWLSRAA